MPEIQIHFDSTKLFTDNERNNYSPVGMMVESMSGEHVCRSLYDAASYAEPGGIVLDLRKIRFHGYSEFAAGVTNMPEILVSITMFPRRTVKSAHLSSLCSNFADDIENAHTGIHIIVKTYCGDQYGFAELNKSN